MDDDLAALRAARDRAVQRVELSVGDATMALPVPQIRDTIAFLAR